MRLNRTVSKGKVHYVVQRGHNGSDIFFDDKDRETYLTVVFEGGVRYKAVIHAFQLLQHEAHWLFTPHEENSIALTVQSVEGNMSAISTNVGEGLDTLGWSI